MTEKTFNRKGRYLIYLLISAILAITCCVYANMLHTEVVLLEQNPAFRIVKSCDAPEKPLMQNHIVTNKGIVECK